MGFMICWQKHSCVLGLFWYWIASLVGIPVGIVSSAVGTKVCATTPGIKKYKSITKKKKRKHDKIVLLAKTKLDTGEVVICKALIDLYINDEDLLR